MATTSPVHTTLFNPELLDMILLYLQHTDIASVRLCCRALNVLGSPHLFRTLVLSLRKRHFRRLERVAAREEFAKGVRELVFETSYYGGGSKEAVEWQYKVANIAELLRLTESDSKERKRLNKRQAAVGIARLYALRKDESSLWPTFYKFEWAKSFRSFTGLRTVVVTNWYEGDDGRRKFLDRDSVLGMSSTMPPPLLAMHASRRMLTYQNLSVTHLLTALSYAGCSLKQFIVRPTSKHTLGVKSSQQLEFPGIRLTFDRHSDAMMDKISRSLLHLTKLHLDVSDDHVPGHMMNGMHQLNNEGRLARFLARLVQVEEMYIRVIAASPDSKRVYTVITPLQNIFGGKHFHRLRSLTLDSFWLESDELCRFLSQHQAPLEELKLVDTNLGGTRDMVRYFPDTVQLPLPPKHVVQSLESGPSLSWLQVAESCQELPKLRGLIIRLPSASANWKMLSLFDTEELIKVGMHGRVNELVGNKWPDICKAWGLRANERF